MEDPALAQVSTVGTNAAGSTSVTVEAAAARSTPVWVFTTAAKGETRVRLEIPGFPEQFYRVRIGALEARCQVGPTSGSSRLEQGDVTATPFLEFVIDGQPVRASAVVANLGERPQPPAWRLEILTPGLLDLLDSSGFPASPADLLEFAFNDPTRPRVRLWAKRPGQARIRVPVPGTEIAPFEWTGEILPRTPLTIPPDLGARNVYSVSIAPQVRGDTPRIIRLVSSDPSMVGLSLQSEGPGAGEITLSQPETSLRQIYFPGVACFATIDIQDATGAMVVVSRRTMEIRLRGGHPWIPPLLK